MCKSSPVEAEADDHQRDLFLQSPRANILLYVLVLMLYAFLVRFSLLSLSRPPLALFFEPHFWAGPVVVGVYSMMETECRTLTRIYQNRAIGNGFKRKYGTLLYYPKR